MYETGDWIEKVQVEAQIELENGQRLLGFLYAKQMQRISDLLNDQREFLPFLTSEGEVLHIRKAKIVSVLRMKQETQDVWEHDPYSLLGLEPEASDEELKHAYYELCRQYHPDKLRTFDLPVDLRETAKAQIIRIIDAYDRIKRQRDEEAAESNPSASNDDWDADWDVPPATAAASG